MVVIVVGRVLIVLFSTLIAWCGIRWHIGYTIQNRYSWGILGSYIPLLQR
jgi:NCS1 family nucleobase:cation symporter-1